MHYNERKLNRIKRELKNNIPNKEFEFKIIGRRLDKLLVIGNKKKKILTYKDFLKYRVRLFIDLFIED